MSHRERHRWVKEISRINKRINKASGASQQQEPRPQSAFGPAGPFGRGGAFGGGLNLTNPDPDEDDF